MELRRASLRIPGSRCFGSLILALPPPGYTSTPAGNRAVESSQLASELDLAVQEGKIEMPVQLACSAAEIEQRLLASKAGPC